MCGIVGYVGSRNCTDVLINGLTKLEYRGYDSAGIAVFSESGNIQVAKSKGRLADLIHKWNRKADQRDTLALDILAGQPMANHLTSTLIHIQAAE